MIIKDLRPFVGQHCETTTVGTLLAQLDIHFSEAMLFGIGEGLGYIYWNMKAMDFPFIGGRSKPDLVTAAICQNLNLDLMVQETTSREKAWQHVENRLASGKAVGLKLDCYHLEYFNTKVNFAGHYAAMYGFDDKWAYLVDTEQQGLNTRTSLESLAEARAEKGPMSSRNLSFTMERSGPVTPIEDAIRTAIANNAQCYVNPPITNMTYKGILKTSKEIKKWFDNSRDRKYEFGTAALLMERAGTGGSLFRNLYRDFLGEAHQLTGDHVLAEARDAFIPIADLWREVAGLLDQAGETEDRTHIEQASEILVELSGREESVMRVLAAAYPARTTD